MKWNKGRKRKAGVQTSSGHLLLSEKVPDLDGGVGVGDGGVDGEVSVDESHLVAVSLGDAGDEVLDVGDGGADGGHGARRTRTIGVSLAGGRGRVAMDDGPHDEGDEGGDGGGHGSRAGHVRVPGGGDRDQPRVGAGVDAVRAGR